MPRAMPILALISAAAVSALCALGCRGSSSASLDEPRRDASNIDIDTVHMIPRRPISTYSIVARDAATGALGVAVQSHWFSVGPVVPWAESGVGAVATQSLVEISYGPLGLDLMRGGKSAPQALAALLAADEGSAVRQVAMIDAEGRVAAHTGARCIAHANHVTQTCPDGAVISCQANLMGPTGVPEAMAAAFQRTTGDLSTRLLAALEAAQATGGDVRGKQSAAILVVSGQPSGMKWRDRLVDLRVEDHPDPVVELTRLLHLRKAYDHMDEGDKAIEKNDVAGALEHYSAAMAMAPHIAEMRFWTAVSLVNAGEIEQSVPLFAESFADDSPGADWRETLRRLPASGLFPDDPALMQRILALPAKKHSRTPAR